MPLACGDQQPLASLLDTKAAILVAKQKRKYKRFAKRDTTSYFVNVNIGKPSPVQIAANCHFVYVSLFQMERYLLVYLPLI